MKKENILCFDIETTGLNPLEDEILQISVLDGNGRQLYNGYVKPEKHTEWADTAAINGITPEMVEDAPTIREILPQIQGIFDRAELVVGYNCDGFDLAFLEQAGLEINTPTFDVMREYIPIAAEIDENGGYKRQNLRKCSAHYGYEGEGWHDSLTDTRATLHCFYGVIRDQGWQITDDEILEPTTMRVVYVKPGEPAEIIEINRGLESLQQAVGGDIEAVYPFEEPVALICNEEGKLEPLPFNRALYDEDGQVYDIIYGSFLITGIGQEDFCSLSEKQAERFAKFYRDPRVFRREEKTDEEIDREAERAIDEHEAEFGADGFRAFRDDEMIAAVEARRALDPDDHLTGERVYTIRGAFQLTDLTYEQMQKAGYGIHHGSEDRKYWIMSNGTDAFAVRRDAPKPDTNITNEPPKPKGMKL